ncbi:TetR/AcrR family transcriptional regulator [Marinomonas sp. 2405UD68-3]|uniref:TetR/AcrR family transcriptional regulator n=1 Tax=Marinomonas sp. 2405UD68-3 TaxID=3391835 RepID=UPI0039C8DA13
MSLNESVSAQKKSAIIEAAIEEFIACGFRKASMDKISSRADVSKRTVYKHFISKENLFSEITESIWSETLKATEYEYSSSIPLNVQLTDIAKQELALITSDRYLNISRMLMAENMITPEIGIEALSKVVTLESGLKRWIKSAKQDGALALDNIDLATTQFLGLLKGAAYWPQIIYRKNTLDDSSLLLVVDSAVNMFLAMYKKQDKGR